MARPCVDRHELNPDGCMFCWKTVNDPRFGDWPWLDQHGKPPRVQKPRMQINEIIAQKEH